VSPHKSFGVTCVTAIHVHNSGSVGVVHGPQAWAGEPRELWPLIGLCVLLHT
jgi:hypothetical protein